jgi:hypothetical protein
MYKHATTTATNHVPIIGATGLCYHADAGAGTLTHVLLLAMLLAA